MDQNVRCRREESANPGSSHAQTSAYATDKAHSGIEHALIPNHGPNTAERFLINQA